MAESEEIYQEGLQLPMKRNLLLYNEIDSETIKETSQKIIEINENDEYLEKLYAVHDLAYKRKPIKLRLESYGGEIYPGLGLSSLIESSKTPVYTYGVGSCMSITFLILISGHRRFAYKYSTLMNHQGSGFLFGTLKDIEENVKEYQRLEKICNKIILEKTNITQEKLDKIYKRKKDFYFTAQEALKLGVIDEII